MRINFCGALESSLAPGGVLKRHSLDDVLCQLTTLGRFVQCREPGGECLSLDSKSIRRAEFIQCCLLGGNVLGPEI